MEFTEEGLNMRGRAVVRESLIPDGHPQFAPCYSVARFRDWSSQFRTRRLGFAVKRSILHVRYHGRRNQTKFSIFFVPRLGEAIDFTLHTRGDGSRLERCQQVR